jgi:hypothetical protein
MYKEDDFKKMASDPKFMADRWLARARLSESEFKKRSGSLSSEEKRTKQNMIKAQYERAEKYKKEIR